MKKCARILAVLAAAATLGLGMMSCDYWNEDWYKNGEGSASESSGSATYTGSLTVNGVTYTSLTMNGSPSSGTAVLSGNSGNASGSYSNSGGGRAAVTLNLNGSYTLTFSFGTITAVFSNPTVTLSQGSVSASGTASLSSSTEPAISTLSGKTFVNTADSNDYIVGLSDSTLEWHNPPTEILNLINQSNLTSVYNSSTGVVSCTYHIYSGGEGPDSNPHPPVPYVFVDYGICWQELYIESTTALKGQFGPSTINNYVQQ